MKSEKSKYYYQAMLNSLSGLQDDFDANQVPDEARALLDELIEICASDFRMKFGSQN